jgi:valyl-tRNA synthetase
VSFQELVAEVRRFRTQQGLQPGRKVPATLVGDLDSWGPYLSALADLQVTSGTEMPDGLAVLTSAGTRVGLDLSGAVDRDAEKARLSKQLAAAEKEREQTGRKLANDGFLAKAPEQVVTSMRERFGAAESEIERLREQLARLDASA